MPQFILVDQSYRVGRKIETFYDFLKYFWAGWPLCLSLQNPLTYSDVRVKLIDHLNNGPDAWGRSQSGRLLLEING